MSDDYLTRLQALKEHFLTSTDLGNALGISRAQISRLLSGKQPIGHKHQSRIKQLEDRIESESKQSQLIDSGVDDYIELRRELEQLKGENRAYKEMLRECQEKLREQR